MSSTFSEKITVNLKMSSYKPLKDKEKVNTNITTYRFSLKEFLRVVFQNKEKKDDLKWKEL